MNQAAVVASPPNHAGITVIAYMKLFKGLALVASAVGALELRGHGADEIVHWIIDHAHLAPEGRLVTWLWSKLNTLTDGKLALIGKVGLAYGIMQLVESYGLFRRRRWAEWLVVIATTIPVPFELYELFHEPSLGRFGILLVNSVIAVYLWHRRTDFLSAKQWRRLRGSRSGKG